MLELFATDEEDFAELDDATELLLFAEELLDPGSVPGMTLEEEPEMTLEEELLATEEEDVAELEDSSELELATELLDSSLGELRMTLEEEGDSGSVPGMTLEEELLATEEEDLRELEEATELLLFAEELLDPSTPALPPLRMTLEEEESSSLAGPFEDSPSPQAARPKASAKAPTAVALNPKFNFLFFIESSNHPFF